MDCTRLVSESPLSAVRVTVFVPFCSDPCCTGKVLLKLSWPLKFRTPTDEPFTATVTLCG